MDILLLTGVGVLLLLGLIGSVIPVLPGPLLSYIALLLFHLFINRVANTSLILIGIGVVLISILDYFLQIYGVKAAGGDRYAIRGSILGILLGAFLFPPFGILLGAFIGAYIGARIEMGKNAIKIASGALIGFIMGIVLKLSISFYIIYFLLYI